MHVRKELELLFKCALAVCLIMPINHRLLFADDHCLFFESSADYSTFLQAIKTIGAIKTMARVKSCELELQAA